ncbi:MAG: 5-amino-6-(D-ribitylamino)uracil--L-tyrosine 4-hydroxyphenyl transferase CofH [Acidimicrobiales bacterium]|nr:5-amino-6-(D-ribitylamino)uracil--L-tyrosine 4-hydroxyphenyl transferase CofH [Acidimicrobiales bacterium]
MPSLTQLLTSNVILAQSSTEELLSAAARIRDGKHGSRITYSPKVFIPLTMLCRDQCGYCTFAQPPARLDHPYLSPTDVLKIARRGARAGCHEALFTLGERPELRYPAAQEWLTTNGYESTIHYLAAMAQLVLMETGLLPHANAGALYANELEMLRPVAASQGMMIESLRSDLVAHRNAPDKDPARRLATLNFAGEMAIPFTTGILVGIGEHEIDRIHALDEIAKSHRLYGHVQEVIVQNFLPKEGTSMWKHDACPPDDYLRAIALARIILPPEIHLQAPPNLSDDFGQLLRAGIDDWGGVSPVTADHVNPERPWPEVDHIRMVTEQAGFVLAPRLTIYPEFALDPHTWLHEDLHFAVMDRAESQLLARDDPGAVFPEKAEFIAANTGTDGAEVVLTGERSTQWYSGSPSTPPHLLNPDAVPTAKMKAVLDGIEAGEEPGFNELLTLVTARGSDVAAVAAAADRMRFELVGNDVTYVKNRNINYTNVCTFKCRFCGFSKGPLSLNLRGTPYLLTLEDMQQRVVEAVELGATEVCLQGGIHPDFDGEYYIDVTKAVRAVAPDIHIHGFTALEVTEGAKRLGEPLDSYLTRLMEAGQKSLPGTAAEILDDRVREILCPDKINTEEWLEAHRTAHKVGLFSNVTMMFGSVEQPESWVKHLLLTRDLQIETGGFTEFVGLPFVHMAAPLYLRKMSRRGPTFRETLLIHAVARLAYGPLIPNIQSGWVKIGLDGVRQMLQAGCNDLGGTLMSENISRAAGASHGQGLTAEDFEALVAPLGRSLVQRTTGYHRV